MLKDKLKVSLLKIFVKTRTSFIKNQLGYNSHEQANTPGGPTYTPRRSLLPKETVLKQANPGFKITHRIKKSKRNQSLFNPYV